MERDKQKEKSIEELSSLLDELNIGRDAKSDDPETDELLSVQADQKLGSEGSAAAAYFAANRRQSGARFKQKEKKPL